MLAVAQLLIGFVVLSAYVVLGSAALSLGQAWAESAAGWKRVRYVIAWAICTAALALPVFSTFVFPGEFASAHSNVGWTALPLSALTTAAALGYVQRRWASVTHGVGFFKLATRLFPIHLEVLIILGAVDLFILGFVFVGNIH